MEVRSTPGVVVVHVTLAENYTHASDSGDIDVSPGAWLRIAAPSLTEHAQPPATKTLTTTTWKTLATRAR